MTGQESQAAGEIGGRQPIATIAIPVYNEQGTIGKAIASATQQTLSDIQILIFDNASTDGTEEICREFVSRDSRIEYHRHPSNIGLLPNFNATFPASRGKYLRWLGADDWLDPEYLEKCTQALEAHPEAVIATCAQAWVRMATGEHTVMLYDGRRVIDEDPVKRFSCLLGFWRMNAMYLDPIYSLHRRSALERTCLFPLMKSADQILAAELAILGPYVHVPEVLSYRSDDPIPDVEQLYAILTNDPDVPRGLQRLVKKEYAKVISRHGLSAMQQLACKLAVQRLIVSRGFVGFYRRMRAWIGRVGRKTIRTNGSPQA